MFATLWSFVDHKQTAYTNHLNGMYLACSAAAAAAFYLSTENVPEWMLYRPLFSRSQFVSIPHRIFCKRNFSINFLLAIAFRSSETHTQRERERERERWSSIELCWNVVAHILQFFMLSRRKIGFILCPFCTLSLPFSLFPLPFVEFPHLRQK